MKTIDLVTLTNVTGGAAATWNRPGQWNGTNSQWAPTNSTKPATNGSWSGSWNNTWNR